MCVTGNPGRGGLVLVTLAALVVVPQPAIAGDEKGSKYETALDGYCVVSYQTAEKALKGDPSHRAAYRGFMYYFADEAAKRTFETNPDRYVPQLGGLCTTALGGPYGNSFAGDPTVFAVYQDRLYLFSSERAKRAYDKKPAYYIGRAAELYKRPELQGYCPVSYLLTGKAVRGRAEFTQVFRGKVYHLASAQAQAALLTDGAKYIPKYDGLCAEGVSRMKRYPAAPTVFAIHDGKTYLFFDAKGKAKFKAGAAELIKQADANWPKLKERKAPQ